MLQSSYLTEVELADFGFKSLGHHVRISSDARIYGPENIEIGSHVRIDDFSILAGINGLIEIGNYVYIARNCHVGGTFGVVFGDFSSLAANTVIYSASDDYTGNFLTAQVVPSEYTKKTGGRVVIGRHVIIGVGSVILGQCIVGEGCSVGSMSLVKNNLDPWGVYVGVPCKRLKERKKDLLELETQVLKKSLFNEVKQ